MAATPRLECLHGHFDAISANPDAACWHEIAPVFLKESVTGSQPKQATWIKTAWNEHELRVLFHATDTNAWATLTGHDAPLFEEEVVEVFLDPSGDLESYFEIEVNPLNAVCDLVLRRTRSGYRKDFGWHCEGLRTAVCKSESAWTVEMAVPFRNLVPSPPAAGSVWRANFFRIDRPENSEWELSAWSPTGLPLFHVQEKFGHLEFVR